MNFAIILAAGKGERMKISRNKLLSMVAGHPLIYYSISAFQDNPLTDGIIVVANSSNRIAIKDIVKKYKFSKVKKIIDGGATRFISLEKGMSALPKSVRKNDIILVHNGANPLPSQNEISKCIQICEEKGGCIVGHFVKSTIKEVDKKHIIKTHDRQKIFFAETPQAARFEILQKALKNAEKMKLEATDEAMLLEAIGEKISYIEADKNNFKITDSNDLEKLKAILGETPNDFRVGIGQDSHVFDEKELGLTIGGITLKDEKKMKANSDGDVILHAIFNAISQAIGEMSIGFYADDLCKKGVKDSKKYLEPLLKKITKQKYKINSVGLMLECKTPKIDKINPQLKKSLSEILKIDPKRIGITATSGENITPFGKGIGIQCFAIVSLRKDEN